MTGLTEFGVRMGPVAKLLLGEPNPELSNGHELRYGSHGSLSVDLDAGTWFDHEGKVGGGVLDLVRRQLRCDQAGALDWLREKAILEPRPERPRRAKGRVVARYLYEDTQGRPRHRTLRWNPRGFSQQRFEDGRWIGGKGALNGVERVLYHEKDLIAAAEVIVVEGEKDADRLRSLGFAATTCAEGARKWRPEYAETPGCKCVVVI